MLKNSSLCLRIETHENHRGFFNPITSEWLFVLVLKSPDTVEKLRAIFLEF